MPPLSLTQSCSNTEMYLGSICCRPRPLMPATIPGLAISRRVANVFLETLASQRKSGKWVSQRLSSRHQKRFATAIKDSRAVCFADQGTQLFALEHMRDRYWHNMAGRIQRAFRNYLRYKQECASRIQRFWKNKKDGLGYVQLRDYGHQVLAQRKERRRFSLVSMRQFRGDYLDVAGRSAQGEMLRSACSIGCAQTRSSAASV